MHSTTAKAYQCVGVACAQESATWQVSLRALCALEEVLQRGSNQACGEIAVMFQSDPSPIRAAVQSGQAQLREHAARVLKLLLNEDVPVSSTQATTTTTARKTAATGRPAAAAPVPDLLTLDDEPPTASAAPAAASIDLLGELTGAFEGAAPATPAPVPADAAGSLFQGLDVGSSSTTAAAAATAGSADMFGGLSVGNGGTSAGKCGMLALIGTRAQHCWWALCITA